MNLKPFYLFFSLAVLAADQFSKLWATARLKPVSTIEALPGYFRFSYATNRGVAFSLFADSSFDVRWVLAAISAAAAVFVASYLLRTLPGERRLNTSLALLLAGITGNLIDRVRLGEVVDFIEVHWRDQFIWPTFNIADSAICTGAALLALEMMREAKADRTVAPQAVPNEEGAD
jgi:signal peptidase II